MKICSCACSVEPEPMGVWAGNGFFSVDSGVAFAAVVDGELRPCAPEVADLLMGQYQDRAGQLELWVVAGGDSGIRVNGRITLGARVRLGDWIQVEELRLRVGGFRRQRE